MNFAYAYSDELATFRQEVRTWLQANIPEKMKAPIDPRDFTEEQYWFWRGINKKLGAKGWLFPTYPTEYGGGGLTGDHEAILMEEYQRIRWAGPLTDSELFPALLVWATEEQKQKFLRPLLSGEKVAWQKFTEPESGADLANYQSTAVREGDEWVLTGNNCYISGTGPAPDYLFGMARTDPDAPRHRNLGYFMIPVPSPGLGIWTMDMIQGRDLHHIILDGIRVPADSLIGGDHQGWQVAILTDAVHQKARIEHIASDRIRADLAQGRVVVVAGFQGVAADGSVTTLGRAAPIPPQWRWRPHSRPTNARSIPMSTGSTAPIRASCPRLIG
jgi:hypothetical protein